MGRLLLSIISSDVLTFLSNIWNSIHPISLKGKRPFTTSTTLLFKVKLIPISIVSITFGILRLWAHFNTKMNTLFISYFIYVCHLQSYCCLNSPRVKVKLTLHFYLSVSLLFNMTLIEHLRSYYSEERLALWAAPVSLNFTLRRIKANYINLT